MIELLQTFSSAHPWLTFFIVLGILNFPVDLIRAIRKAPKYNLEVHTDDN